MMMIESLSSQRKALGLRTPSYQAKELIWSQVISPTAGIKAGYRPLQGGARKAHRADSRGIAVSGGWRAGKSLTSGMEGVTWLPYADLIWLVGTDYDLSRQEFVYLAEGGLSTGLVQHSNLRMPDAKYQPWSLRSVTGCLVEQRTLADFRKLAGRPPDLVIVCEPGLIDNLKNVMELLWGRVSEKRGCIVLAGTSDEASEEWYELWESWHDKQNPFGGTAVSIPTWQNIHRFPRGRNDPEFAAYQAQYGEESLMAHYGGIPASPRNLILRGYWNRATHIQDIGWNPLYPTEIAIDPNYSLGHRYTVEVIQWDEGSGRIWVVDEVAVEGMTHEEVREECEAREWWTSVQGGVIDPYAGESHVYGSHAPTYYWPSYLRFNNRPRVNTTVQALKEALNATTTKLPRLTVSPKCERLIWEAHRWRQEKMGQPQKDNCDALKALGYWLVDHLIDERAGLHMREDDNIVIARDWKMAI